MQWFNHKFSLVNQVLRLFQIVGAIVCIVYYGKDLNAAAKQDKYVDSKWVRARPRLTSNPSSLLTQS